MEISLLPLPRLAPTRCRDPLTTWQIAFSAIQVHFSIRPFSLWAGRTANLLLYKAALCCPFGIRRHSLLPTSLKGSVLLKKKKKKGPANKQNKEPVRPKWLARIFRWVGCSTCFLHAYSQRAGKWGCLPLINLASKERSWGKKGYHQGCGQIKGKIMIF